MKTFILALLLCFGLANVSLSAPPVFENDYEKAVESEGKVLVIFGTNWCRYCKYLKKDMDSLNLDNYTVCVIDAEKRKDLIKKHGLNSYPTSIILEQKKESTRKSGYEKKEYQSWLDANR